MASSAPHSPARYRDIENDSNASPSRPSPSKLLRIQQIDADLRAASVPPRRVASPAKKVQVRPRLNQYYTIDHAVSLFKKSKNIVVLTGAGISTSLGVPDFRSKTGVYNLLDGSPYNDPQDLFHIDNFKTNPEIFFKQAKKIFPRMQGLVPSEGVKDSSKPVNYHLVPKYSSTHAFISLLQAKGKLLTNYTQNIDGLETVAGVSGTRLIQCHGSLSTASCMSCGKQVSAKKYMPVVHGGSIPVCKCSMEEEPKRNKSKKLPRGRSGKKKRKRHEYEDTDSDDDDDHHDFMKGLLKPDMTFFGEHVSYSYAPRLASDKSKVDLLVIIGTSLKVAPVNEMLFMVPPTVPQIWISKERCQREGVKVDIELLGECDLIIDEICRRAGWSSALDERKWSPAKAPLNGLKEKDSNLNLEREQTKDLSTEAKKKRKSAPSSPIEPETQTLEMRPKVNDAAKRLAVPSTMPIPQIKLNFEDLPSTTSAEEAHILEHLSKYKKPDTEDPLVVVKTEEHACPPPKVIIELELGTRSRWFVKRALCPGSDR
ncbi:uncharacterized protein A1O9_10771 [Exophiala aquamarina CBS 119918]|uniref:Deacetylase sirtuin-type domain-containing protein n=1 Tax=Exophiala aquamarina CBS 119918 TaxID=1182545 RepID=A0A072P245_9EURO|nr:uncharacterized protein A1O9_10771 [Exophiala aquamarina CBS 119918]KEF53323.1 hypothetical protein A1O9_10771 [Exophiala aquamarina CBS 119918]